ncbi:MAG: glycine cleavage system protein R [Solirubrobacterales bacterium]
MRSFVLSGVGQDRPGIVAATAQLLLRHGMNIEDSRSSLLRGHFTMMIMVAGPDHLDVDALRADLAETQREIGLQATSLSEVWEVASPAEPSPSLIVTVYGADHPGIVHAVTAILAERGANITDLTTRLVGGDEGAGVYAMMMEVAVPAGTTEADLRAPLEAVAREQGLEATVRPLERDVL